MYLPDADRNRKTKTRIISLRQLTDLCVCGAVLVPVWSAGNGGVPQGPGLWNHVFKTNRESFNLQAIKQDHMCEEINLPQMSSTVNVARDWLAGMGQGAEQQNFSIQ